MSYNGEFSTVPDKIGAVITAILLLRKLRIRRASSVPEEYGCGVRLLTRLFACMFLALNHLAVMNHVNAKLSSPAAFTWETLARLFYLKSPRAAGRSWSLLGVVLVCSVSVTILVCGICVLHRGWHRLHGES